MRYNDYIGGLNRAMKLESKVSRVLEAVYSCKEKANS